MNWQHLYLSFAGRTSRRDFWIGLGGLVGAGLVASLMPVIGTAVSLALIYPALALLAKRLHDFGRSAWLSAIAMVPGALALALASLAGIAASDPTSIGPVLAAGMAAALLGTLAMVAGVGFLAWAGTRNSDAGPNAYGDPACSVLLR